MKRILIAEDNRLQGKVLADHLTRAGYECELAPDGRAALDAAKANPPDLIVSDIEMPHMTGYELCRAIKTDHDVQNVPFILLSTLSEPEDIIRGLDCGADNYVTKPYRLAYLVQRIEAALNTPVDDAEDVLQLDVTLAGTEYSVRSGRQQVLNLLVSTFENAVEKNRELMLRNEDLTLAKERLDVQHRRLTNMNARMTRDLDAAAKIQHSLLPPADRSPSGIDVAWRYTPCDELAGDFLNFFRLDEDHWALFVVDVSGHGVPSSLLSVTVARALSADLGSSSPLVRRGDNGVAQPTPPAEVAAELNRRFPMEDQGNLYFTLVYAVLNVRTRTLRYSSAGHNPIALVPKNGDPKLLPAEGFAIGWMDDSDYDQHELTLSPGDRIYLYSDGVPEALDENLTEFDEPRMLSLMGKCRQLDLDQSVETIQQAVQHWCRINGPKDDVSILGVEIPEVG